jgi:hypothetical protein
MVGANFMGTKNSPKGSKWRRWDQHLHAPETKLANGYGAGDEVWDEYVDFLEASPVEAFGLRTISVQIVIILSKKNTLRSTPSLAK